jgi:hypothetical protein
MNFQPHLSNLLVAWVVAWVVVVGRRLIVLVVTVEPSSFSLEEQQHSMFAVVSGLKIPWMMIAEMADNFAEVADNFAEVADNFVEASEVASSLQ